MQSNNLPLGLIWLCALLVRITEENCSRSAYHVLLEADQWWRKLGAYESVVECGQPPDKHIEVDTVLHLLATSAVCTGSFVTYSRVACRFDSCSYCWRASLTSMT